VEQGALNYSLALDLPPGIAGVAPQLSLDYSSNTGNGYLGQGWSIGGLSSISRCGSSLVDDGRNRGVMFDEKDNYCLDGQRLIAVKGEVGGVGTEYRTQIESYTKVLSVGGSIGNPASFKVWMKSGDIYEYGMSKNSVDIIDYKNSFWYLNKISDRYNNSINFNYTISTNSIPKISSIEYAKNKINFIYDSREDRVLGFRKGKPFVMNEKLKSVTIEVDNISMQKYNLDYYPQNDSFSKLKLNSITECIASDCTEPLTFKWQDDNLNLAFESNSLQLNENTELNGTNLIDLNGDGLVDIYETHGESSPDTVWINDGKGSFEATFNPNIRAKVSDIRFVDVNNDGLLDIYEVSNSGYGTYTKSDSIWLNNGQGNFTKSSLSPLTLASTKSIHFVDIDSDGDTDMVVSKDNLWKIFINNGQGIFSHTKSMNFETNLTPNTVQFSDVNDDGNIDIITSVGHFDGYNGQGTVEEALAAGGEIYSYSWDGTVFYYAIKETNQISIYLNDGDENFTKKDSSTIIQNVYELGSKTTRDYFRDFNGDGILDILSVELGAFVNTTRNGKKVTPKSKLYLSTKNATWIESNIDIYGHEGTVNFSDLNGDGSLDIYDINKGQDNIWINNGLGKFTISSIKPSIDIDAYKIRFADFNGDGFLDIFTIDADSNNEHVTYNDDTIYLNDRRGNFVEKYNLNIHAELQKIQLADLNGDGSVDIAVLNRDTDIYINKMKSTLLTEVKDSFKNKIMIDYKQLSDSTVYSKSDDLEKNTKNIQIQRFVVSSINQDNGLGGRYIVSYEYNGLKYNYYRGLLGFKEIITTDSYGGKIITEYYQQFPFTGNIKSTKNYIDDELISESTSTLDYAQKGKQYIIKTKSTTQKNYDNGSLLSTITTNYNSYDNYGNVLKMTTTTEGKKNFTKTTDNKYDNKEENWMLGHLKEAKVTHEGWGKPKIRKSSFTYTPKGSIETETIEPGNALELTTTYGYDTFGNIKTKTISAPSLKEDRVTSYKYSSDGRYLLRTTNPIGHSNTNDNEYNTIGQLIKSTDANGLVTIFEYDRWGKKTLEKYADGTFTKYAYAYSSKNGAKYKVTVTSTGNPETVTYYDKYDRVVLETSKRFDGEVVSVETKYNAKGEVEKKSLPHTEDETAKYILYSYDVQGRPIETVKPSPSDADETISETISYDKLSVTVTSPGTVENENLSKTTTENVLGQVIKVEQEEGTYVEYEYDAIGNLVKTIPNGIKVMAVKMQYDILGNKIAMQDPDMGSWSYTYDALGQLKTQTDAKKQKTSIEYDKLGRKTKEITEDGISNWSYDKSEHGLGKLTSESTDGITKTYSYTSNGKIKEVKTDVYNKSFTQSYAYNADGKLKITTQPNGFKLINTYNAQGYLESIKAPAEQVKDENQGNDEEDEDTDSLGVELIDESESWNTFGEIWSDRTYTRTYNGEKYTYVPTKTAGSGAYKSVTTEVGKTYRVSGELIGADVNRDEEFVANTYLTVTNSVPQQSIPVVGKDGVLAFESQTGGSKTTKTITFVATSTTSYISVRSDRDWKYANARALSVKKIESTESENNDEDLTPAVELIDESESWNAFGEIWSDRTYTRTYNGEIYTYVPTKTAGSGAYKSVVTEVGKTYTVSAELLGADVNRDEEFVANTYLTVTNSVPQQSIPVVGKEGVLAFVSQTGGSKTTKTITFVATSTTSYISVRSDRDWKYANARALSVKELKKQNEIKFYKDDTTTKNKPISNAYQKVLVDDSNHVYLYKVLEQNSMGQVTKYLSGNGLTTEDVYNESGVMTNSKTGFIDDGAIRELSYAYYDNLSLKKREDKKLGITQTYGYDALDRIAYSTVNSNTLGFSSHNYEYDVYGDMITKDGNTLKYDNGNHQVSSLEDGKTFHYDPNGNMDRNGNTKIEYNAQNKATRIITDKNSITFNYDMNQNRFIKSQKFTDTYYLGKGYEYTEDGNGNITHKYLIYANGKVVAVHNEVTSKQELLLGKKGIHYTQYLHYDSLGSVDTITNQDGVVVERMAYKPFGEKLDLVKLQESITNRGFTGHEHIEDTPFIHMNARLYDPTIGRFLSADTYIQAAYDTQSYNRYSYVRNNPLKYVDPSGHFWGIGGKIKREYRRFERRVSDHADEITGVIMMVAGALLIETPYGAGLMATGAGLIKGEYHIFNGDINIEYNVSYTTSLGGNSGGLTSSQQNIIAQGRALDARDSMRATTTSSGSPYIDVSGIDYVYGEDSDPYGDVYVGEVSISYMTPTDEMILAQVLSTDVADLAYTAFTFTNVGAVYDTISQYSNGDISTTELFLQGGTGLLLGGAGAKIVKYGSKSISFLHETHIDDLIPTQGLTRNADELRELRTEVQMIGIQEPIIYTSYRGGKYIVDGHHRRFIGNNLGLTHVPTIEVGLPYKGYSSINDLFY